MIIVAGRLHVDSAQRAAYLVGTADVAVLARRAPGCLDFVQAADPVDPTRINVYERWESDADVEAFRTSGDPDAPEPELPAIVDAAVSKYRISSVEAP